MKILAIMGSPHSGNTLQLTQRIEARLTRHSDVEFEYLHLKDIDLRPCRGCFQCFIDGEENCPLKDDREYISQKLLESDAVIFVTPVYAMHVSYLMKLFIDRLAYTFHRPRYFGKYALTVAATGGIGLKGVLKYMKMVAITWGFEHVGELGVIAPPQNTKLGSYEKHRDRTDEVVNRFYRAIKENKPRKLTFEDHVTFRAMRAVYSNLEIASPTDFNYWKGNGWFDENTKYFYSDVKTNIFYDLIARIIAWMIGRKVKKGIIESKL